jgi:diacylglycerol kinase (ATP)
VGLSVAGIVVANGPCFGGGMRIAPGADPADGALDLVVLGALARWELALWLPTLYWGGHLRHPRVRLARVRRVMVEGRGPLRLQADGEPCDGAAGGDWRVEITVLPRALRVRR